MPNRIAIIDGIRTPFCKMGTLLKDFSAQELGALVVRELLERADLPPDIIDEVIFGNVAQPPDAANISRVISLMGGMPISTPAFTVHRNCASGLESVVTACLKIQSGQARCIMTGGTESMSNIPYFLQKDMQEFLFSLNRARTVMDKLKVLSTFRLSFLPPRIGLMLGLTDPICGLNMGQTAEVLAREFGISRQEQDEFALASHQKAAAARGRLAEEILTVLAGRKFDVVVNQDNGVRDNQSLADLQKLRPVFDRHNGTVTAGNASQVTDGAVALLVMDEETARRQNLKSLGFVRAFAFAGVEPQRMGVGPAHAIPRVLKQAGMRLGDIQAIEINEAFAVQVISCLRLLESAEFATQFGYEGYTGTVDPAVLNVNGGAIALGHPVGATGARLILTMLKHMNRNDLQTGLVSLCIGGGQGAALILER